MSTSSSVVLPRAERTATTWLPASRAATIRVAARFKSSGPATDVPPNFMTTVSDIGTAEDNHGMSTSRLRIGLRWGFAALVLGVVAAVAWFVFARDDSDDPREPEQRAAGVSRKADEVVRGLGADQQVDQVLLLGFDGAGRSAAIVSEAGERQLGGVLVGPENGASPELLDAIARAGAAGGRIHRSWSPRRKGASTDRSRSSRRPSGRSTSATRRRRTARRRGRGRRRRRFATPAFTSTSSRSRTSPPSTAPSAGERSPTTPR